ncbi:uncharacterized protein FFUJ_14172 [Fusarium fujikuroi IMI 58289]|uniref:4-dimethylallyltryptophan N-methyltransferase n=1 Tax=Gibberella fujikuroi (strain CBS 195.34 / IMI 58289 / NRRL A-6831) TaxID=1279085 RepID=S0EQ32_GIBF5|nr:uncharacterized protein FFUJ_14172 [Fusarium fujikuroi IMI 58289]CCT76195.1 uncharacterized protein FFUJ_14172 [Fusarium fujikuroi IMI 58289]SCO26783.1 uncharacterized protein FFM5_15052 [Fusarium fujikuroi]
MGQVLNVGGGKLQSYNKALLEKKLFWTQGPFTTLTNHVQRVLPTSIIYGDKGLELWASITHLPSYYQTRGEAALLIENSEDLARWIQKESVLIDLGCGDIRKLIPLLEELDRLQKPVTYCPLDLSHKSIERAMEQTRVSLLPYISVTGLWGTFEDGVEWANRACVDRPRVFLALGSMLGNDHFEDAVERLKWLRSTGLRNEHDRILLTMDGTKDMDKICKSYDDVGGLFTQFIRQGFENSNHVLGNNWYRHEDWSLQRRFTDNPTMHRFVLKANQGIECPTMNVKFREGDEIDCYEGFKYGPEDMARQFKAAGIREYARWKGPEDDICK